MDSKPRILIAYDGSVCADAAVADLARAGLSVAADAMVITVTEAWLQPPPSSYEIVAPPFSGVASAQSMAREQQHEQVDAACSMAFQAAKRIEALYPGWEVRSQGHAGSPASTILKVADDWHADLVVVGSHGRSALGRMVLGSVSHKIVTHARCSVRVAREHHRGPGAPIRILLGVDGSHFSQETVRVVAARSWPEGTEARVVAVYDTLVPTVIGQFIPPVVASASESNREECAWIREMVEACARELRKAGIEVSQELVPGDPRRALVEQAREWDADCIFLGARGLSRLDRFLLGSVSAAVATRAGCSVEIVRTAKGNETT